MRATRSRVVVLADGRAYVSTGIRGFGSMVFTRRNGQSRLPQHGRHVEAETTLASSDTSGGATFGGAIAASGSRVMIGNFRATRVTAPSMCFNRDASGCVQGGNQDLAARTGSRHEQRLWQLSGAARR